MDQIDSEVAQTFLLARGKLQEGAGTWERQKRQQRVLAGLLAPDKSDCSWNCHVIWSCYVPRDRLNIGIKKYSITSRTRPSHKKTMGFSVLWCLEMPMCRSPAFGNVWWYQVEGGFLECLVLDWQSLTAVPRSSISVQDISRSPACQRARILEMPLVLVCGHQQMKVGRGAPCWPQNHRMVGLEGALKIISFQPLCHGQERLPLDQAAQTCWWNQRGGFLASHSTSW